MHPQGGAAPGVFLVGTGVEHDVLDRYPELGGFKVLAVGPGLTMTDKLLAQNAGVAMSGPPKCRDVRRPEAPSGPSTNMSGPGSLRTRRHPHRASTH